LPALRDRREEIPALAAHFAKQIAAQNGWKPKTFEAAALDGLARYGWPGNVRELRNVIERLLLVSNGESVTTADLEQALPAAGGGPAPAGAPVAEVARAGTLAERVESFERALLIEELSRHNHHMTNTAKALGLERSHLYKKCQQLGIDLRSLRKPE
jgi:DNA-binding NtrC family response regulator